MERKSSSQGACLGPHTQHYTNPAWRSTLYSQHCKGEIKRARGSRSSSVISKPAWARTLAQDDDGDGDGGGDDDNVEDGDDI